MTAISDQSSPLVLERAASSGKSRKSKKSGSKNRLKDLILFLHGLGCNKQNFITPFVTPGFYPGGHLLAPDLPGHGAHRGCPPSQASMENMAAFIVQLVSDRECSNLHIIAHSMGCAVALLAMGHFGLTPRSLIIIEGNLTDLDCGLLSRRAAETPRDIFINEKFSKLQTRAAQSAELRDFSVCLQECQPAAFHHAACSLVSWSDSGDLLTLFQHCDAHKIYLYGERSGDSKTLALLHDRNIQTREVPGCSHFAPTENPILFHNLCAAFITESSSIAK